MKNDRSAAEMLDLLEEIRVSDFDLGMEIWNQYLNKSPESLNYRIPNMYKQRMGGKWEGQEYEKRKAWKQKWNKNWDGPDIRIQTKLEAVDFLRRVQCFDVTLGRPLLREFTQDRVIDSDLQCVYSETETIFVATFTNSMIEGGFFANRELLLEEMESRGVVGLDVRTFKIQIIQDFFKSIRLHKFGF